METFRGLHKNMKALLLQKKEYLEKYKTVCREFIQRCDRLDIQGSDKELQHLASSASLQDRINELVIRTKDKEALIKLKEKQIFDVEKDLTIVNEKLKQEKGSRSNQISEILEMLHKISSAEYKSIPTAYNKI